MLHVCSFANLVEVYLICILPEISFNSFLRYLLCTCMLRMLQGLMYMSKISANVHLRASLTLLHDRCPGELACRIIGAFRAALILQAVLLASEFVYLLICQLL